MREFGSDNTNILGMPFCTNEHPIWVKAQPVRSKMRVSLHHVLGRFSIIFSLHPTHACQKQPILQIKMH